MISDFFESHLASIEDPVIRELPETFTTREFIEQFIKYFEEDYVNFLHHYRKQAAFRTVNQQITEALDKHAQELGIAVTGKTEGKSFQGERIFVDQWRKE